MYRYTYTILYLFGGDVHQRSHHWEKPGNKDVLQISRLNVCINVEKSKSEKVLYELLKSGKVRRAEKSKHVEMYTFLLFTFFHPWMIRHAPCRVHVPEVPRANTWRTIRIQRSRGDRVPPFSIQGLCDFHKDMALKI